MKNLVVYSLRFEEKNERMNVLGWNREEVLGLKTVNLQLWWIKLDEYFREKV